MGSSSEVVEKFYGLFADGKITYATALSDPSCITLMPAGALNQVEHEALRRTFRVAFPDSPMVVDHVVKSGTESSSRGASGAATPAPGVTCGQDPCIGERSGPSLQRLRRGQSRRDRRSSDRLRPDADAWPTLCPGAATDLSPAGTAEPTLAHTAGSAATILEYQIGRSPSERHGRSVGVARHQSGHDRTVGDA